MLGKVLAVQVMFVEQKDEDILQKTTGREIDEKCWGGFFSFAQEN